jgi:ketosteroid isomerase-like protein
MSEENVETVRAIFDRTAQGDFSRWLDDVTDDFVFVTSPDLPDAGTYRGEAAKEWVRAWVESFVGHTIEGSDFIDAGDRSSSRSSNGAVHQVAGSRWRVAGGS